MVFKFLKSSFTKVKDALRKTRSKLSESLYSLLGREINEETLEELEQVLYEADLGVQVAQEITESVRSRHRKNPSMNAEEHIEAIKQEVLDILEQEKKELEFDKAKPFVILIVGVNGNGKTTSIAKLAHKFKQLGKSVMVAAGDTFRAAAIDQLDHWAEKVGIPIVKGKQHSDPAAIAFDAVSAAKARDIDILLIDTAGRLHTKTPLMQELEKIKRSCNKVIDGSPHETFLVLDATTGQNALDQAKTFHEFTPISGLILTKLDGTAKGGLAISIQKQLDIPVVFIGVGEGMEDLEPFDPKNFVEALF
ncbi:MAG: signal recognition particle-docking protein FtsY [Chlamydiales bacterium]